MLFQLTEKHRDGAEIYRGDEALCKQKLLELLAEISLPGGLFPLDVIEFGHNKSSGFIWFKHKKKEEHKFKSCKQTVLFDAEITAFAERGRMRNITGIKDKVMAMWVTVTDIFIEDPSKGMITFRAPRGLSGSLPISAFDLKEDKDAHKKTET